MSKTKKLKRPIVMYSITEGCNMGCKHCYNESGKGYTPTSEELFRNTRELSKIAGAVNFTGGEPFLVPKLPELLALSNSLGVDNILTTNGLRFMEKDAPELLDKIQNDVYMLKIGMMGANPETNDYIRGKGHFDVAMKSLDLMSNYDFVSCMKISLDKHNMREIEDFAKIAEKYNVEQLVFGQLIDIGRASKYLTDLFMDLDDIKKVSEDLEKLREKYSDIKISRHCTLSGLCQEPGHFYTVTAKGKVSPCLMREDLAIGNINTDNLESLFKNVDDIRNHVKTHSSVKDIKVREQFNQYILSLAISKT